MPLLALATSKFAVTMPTPVVASIMPAFTAQLPKQRRGHQKFLVRLNDALDPVNVSHGIGAGFK